jgi:hypothetical protein
MTCPPWIGAPPNSLRGENESDKNRIDYNTNQCLITGFSILQLY